MPVIKSAQKKMKQDKKRTARNSGVRNLLKKVIKKARKDSSEKNIIEAIKTTDKAAKRKIIAKNKAARIKSSLSRLLNQKETKTKTDKAIEKPAKTPVVKSKSPKKKTT